MNSRTFTLSIIVHLASVLCMSAMDDKPFEFRTTGTKIETSDYAKIDVPGKEKVIVKKFTLKNDFMSVDVISYGSTIISMKIPDRNGVKEDILLGFDDLKGFQSKENPYFGATVGRVANRISNGKFKIDGVPYQVSQNIFPNTIHGGFSGFDKKVWEAWHKDDYVLMKYKSPDGEEGFPGNLDVEVKYYLTDDNQLVIAFRGTTDKPTPVNIVNHAYFNLAGADKKAKELYEHYVKINANYYTPLNEGLIATGEIKCVESTEYDLRKMTKLGPAINRTSSQGFDINFCDMSNHFPSETVFRPISKLYHPASGRCMEVFSNQFGVQFYTGNSLNNIHGKNGIIYEKHDALCFETQNLPDAINHQDTFPQVILRPNELYNHVLAFKFHVSKDVPT